METLLNSFNILMYHYRKYITDSSHTTLLFVTYFLLFFYCQSAIAVQISPEIKIFIDEMVKNHGFTEPKLRKVFSNAKFQSGIINAISRPSTSKPWYKYHPVFINPSRIEKGLAFWEKNAATLERANKKFGVPEEIITAVIGVETYYGMLTGRHRVLDALVTLAFKYPRRADFFRNELEQYLLLVREQNANILSIKGSYAGAIGIPQFMPSSYRKYAVDFDNDGKIDLSENSADAIGSVANYLITHGWEVGGPLVTRAQTSDNNNRHETLEIRHMPLYTIKEMKELGVSPLTDVSDDRKATLIKLDSKNRIEYWLGFHNFYIITRYNRSTYYAMSVILLSNKIRDLRNRRKEN